MKPIRAVVIGTGWWATTTHIPALEQHEDVELVALCDIDASRLEAAASAFEVERRYTDHREMLENERPDAVVVATTHATHFAVARDCLEAGAHVLIEKPMTLSAHDARILCDLAKRNGRGLLVGYPGNYTSNARKVRSDLESGRFGQIQIVQSVFNSYCADLFAGHDRSDTPGAYAVHGPGAVYSKLEHSGGGHGHLQLTHAAGLLAFTTGLRTKAVQARMENHGLPVDLVNVLLVEFVGGGLGTLSGTSNSFLPSSTLTIGCSNASIELNLHSGALSIREAGLERVTLPPNESVDLRLAPVRNLIGVARGTEAPISTGEDGLGAVEILDAAYRSAREDGRRVRVEELYDR
jgi:predicted dehydrogenase